MEYCNQGHPAHDPKWGCGPCQDEQAAFNDKPWGEQQAQVDWLETRSDYPGEDEEGGW